MPRARSNPSISLWAFLLAAAGLVLAPRPAAAVSVCGGVTHQNLCGSSNICICCSDSDCYGSTNYGDDHGNCVWWAWEKACREWGAALRYCRNANYFDEDNEADGYYVDPEPCVGTIFVCEQNTSYCGAGVWGHVGWVKTVNPNGSIVANEQGCCWFYGVRDRPFDAQLSTPRIDYIYAPGATSCNPCDCSSGDVEYRDCANGCEQEQRSCADGCNWGAWSGCTGCTPGDVEQRECPGGCGAEERTCLSDCTWGEWSGCTDVGECEPVETRSCGVCGTQLCMLDCTWGECDDPCAGEDAGSPDPDASSPDPDASSPDPDAGDPPDGPSTRSGCSCESQTGATGGPTAILLLALVAACLLRRRRSSPRSR